MAIRSNSYGSTDAIGSLCPLYATATGTKFDTSTQPTLAQVEAYVDQISAVVNTLLAEQGFSIPVLQVEAKLALDLFVNQESAHYAEYANGAGPFVPQVGQMRTESPQLIILRDAERFIMEHAGGLELLGATRTRSQTYGLQCRTTDDSGNTLQPPFQLEQMGHSITDWDTS